jgi:hypothetical protein
MAAIAYLRQIIMQTVHILQLDSDVTDSLPRESVILGLLSNNLARFQWNRLKYQNGGG